MKPCYIAPSPGCYGFRAFIDFSKAPKRRCLQNFTFGVPIFFLYRFPRGLHGRILIGRSNGLRQRLSLRSGSFIHCHYGYLFAQTISSNESWMYRQTMLIHLPAYIELYLGALRSRFRTTEMNALFVNKRRQYSSLRPA